MFTLRHPSPWHLVPALLSMLLGSTTLNAQAPDVVIPTYRPQFVRIVGDTTWWIPPLPTRPGPMVVVGYDRRTGTFVAGHRRNQAVGENNPATNAGPLGAADLSKPLSLAYGYALKDTTHQPDPRPPVDTFHVRGSTPRFALYRSGRAIDELRIRVSGAERRRLFLASGEQLKPKQLPPPFTTAISRWAVGDGAFAFAFDTPSPPEREEAPFEAAMAEREGAEASFNHPLYLGGVLLFDTTSKHVRPALHSALVTRQFTGLEIAGGAVWATVSDWMPSDDWTPSNETSSDSIALARYDLARNAWRFYKHAELPVRNPILYRSNGERLYFIGGNAVAVLDARTSQWQVRHLRDSTYLLPSGLDTTVTILSSRLQRPLRAASKVETPDVDTAQVIAFVADELGIRSHRTAFMRELKKHVPVDSLAEILPFMGSSAKRFCDVACPFAGAPEEGIDMQRVLARKEYIPALHEAGERDDMIPYMIDVLQKLGPSHVIDGLRHVLVHGEFRASLLAARELHARGDSSGVSWLRGRMYDADWLEMREGDVDWYLNTPLRAALTVLARLGDTAFLPRALELFDAEAVRPHLGYQSEMVMAITMHGDTTVRAQLLAHLEAHPRYWPILSSIVGMDSISARPWIVPTMNRIALRLVRSSRALTDSIAAGWPKQELDWIVSRSHLTQRATEIVGRMDPVIAVPVLIETFDLDPEWAYMKHYSLIQLTGNDAAPKEPPYGGSANRAAEAAAYWRGWWRDHGRTFKPVSEKEGRTAMERWSRRHYPKDR